jgi:hypothetical protein
MQQEENPFYQQIELTFNEETGSVLHLEHGLLWC